MTRVLSSLLLMAAVLLTGASRASAAESDLVLAPGNPPLTREVADASAAVTIFMLQVVATGDADVDSLELDENLLDAWADAMAGGYTRFSRDEQAQFASLPALRDALYMAWPEASSSDRDELRNAFRPMAAGMLAGMGCDSFVSLAESGLVEPTGAHIARYKRCAEGEPVQVAAPAPSAAAAVAASTPSESPTAAYQRASAGLAASHNMYTNMSNVLLQNHVGNMNAILNMGSSNYRYEYVSKP